MLCAHLVLVCVKCVVWVCGCACIQGHIANLQAVWVQLCCHGNWG